MFLINSNKNVLKKKKDRKRKKKFIKYVLIPHPGKGGAVAPPARHQDLLGFLCALLCSELETLALRESSLMFPLRKKPMKAFSSRQ